MSPLDSTSSFHVLLAGGGSGGHIFPALAVGEELASRGVQVSFAGSPSGMEAELVPARGVAFHPLAARAWVGTGIGGRLRSLATLSTSTLAGARLTRHIGVDVTLATGGYASVPAALGTRLAWRPLVLLEPNAEAGAANRLTSRVAAGACVSPGATPRLHCPLWETGVPVRRAFAGDPTPLPEGSLRVLVLGGSQGSVELNRLVPEALAAADPDDTVSVVHQSGRGLAAATTAAWSKARHRAEVVEFIDDVAAAMSAAHLVISRSGAITLAELAALGRGAILIPLRAAGAHQLANARERERLGGARVVESGDNSLAQLTEVLRALLDDSSAVHRLARAAASLARPQAAAAIADRLLELAARHRSIPPAVLRGAA